VSAILRVLGGAGFDRWARRAVLLPAALGAAGVGRGASGGHFPPLAVDGLAGVTFLTDDPAALRRFYGAGAGLAEVPAAPGRIRFAVGPSQWIEFVSGGGGPRRLQFVTFRARDLGTLADELRARRVPAQWIGADAAGRALEVEDPAGDRIRFAGPAAPAGPAAGPPAGFSRHLQHFGFAVPRARAESVMAFYRETFGWPETFRMEGADRRLDLVKFRPPGGQGELIELIFFDPPLNKWAAGAFDHVNFEVGDIDAAYRALHRGGIADGAKARPEVNGERLWAINLFDPELTRVEIEVLAPARDAIGTVLAEGEAALFDGRTLAGWEGNTGNWRVEDGAIVAGALDRRQPHNEFLATTATCGDFELDLQYKVEGTDGFVNGGVQFWSQRVPGSDEVSGYQADLGAGTDGNLYDESRRNRNLAEAPADLRARILKPGAWNDYRIRAEGARIQIWLNGERTVDYTEADPQIPRGGRFALQIHGGAKTRVSYRGLALKALPPPADAGQ
jgi:hypothetical protein